MEAALWLCENLVVGDSCVLGEEVYLKYKENCLYGQMDPLDTNNFGRLLRAVVPHVTSKRVYRKDARPTQYSGVGLSLESPQAFYIENITRAMLPQGWVVEEHTATAVSFMLDTGVKANKWPVTKSVRLTDEGALAVFAPCQPLSTTRLGLSGRLQLSTTSIFNVLKYVGGLKLCTGKQRPKVISLQSACAEDWDDGKELQKIVRAGTCHLVCLPTASTAHCIPCAKMKVYSSQGDPSDLVLSDLMSKDMEKVIYAILPDATDEVRELISNQQKAATTHKNGMRWTPGFIRMCLSIYCRSPKVYRDLGASGFLRLPSGRLLSYYKNAVPQEPGFNWENLTWMHQEAQNAELPADGRQGGLILDEMSIQQDLQLVSSGDSTDIVGFVDNGVEANAMNEIRKKSSVKEVASKVQQFVFLGFTGFRFPVAHFPTQGATAHDMYIQFWECVEHLLSFNFDVQYTNLDGACINRQFLHMHFDTDNPAGSHQYTGRNPVCPDKPIHFIMDYSHVAKKIRNSIYSSEYKSKLRELQLPDGLKIVWSMWEDAWKWDRQNPLKIHHKLSRAHIFLDDSAKMRNHLAEEVLNADMLQLMMDFQESKGKDGAYLDGAIELLKHAAVLVRVFRDHRPIVCESDARLADLSKVNNWFMTWQDAILEDKTIKQPKRCLITRETREDTRSCIEGFIRLVNYRLHTRPGASIVPARVNSDVVENFFCQQRATYNGAATNPSYRAYQTATNSIILEQPVVSRKSNAGGYAVKASPFAQSAKSRKRKPLGVLNVENKKEKKDGTQLKT